MPNASANGPRRSLSIGAAVALTAVVFALIQLAGFAAVMLRAVSHGITITDAAQAIRTDPVTLAALSAAVLGAAVLLAVRVSAPELPVREALLVRPVTRRAFALCLLGGAAMQVPLQEIANHLQERWPIPLDELLVQHALLTPDTWVDGVGAVIAFALVAPVGEELFFRGVMLPGLERRYGRAPAVFGSAVLFGALHYHGFVVPVVYATIAGFALGALASRTGSVVPAIAAHVGNNGILLLLPERLVRIEGLNTVSEDVYHVDPWLVAGATAAMVACFGLVALGGRDAKA